MLDLTEELRSAMPYPFTKIIADKHFDFIGIDFWKSNASTHIAWQGESDDAIIFTKHKLEMLEHFAKAGFLLTNQNDTLFLTKKIKDFSLYAKVDLAVALIDGVGAAIPMYCIDLPKPIASVKLNQITKADYNFFAKLIMKGRGL